MSKTVAKKPIIPNLSDLQKSKIQVACNGDKINLYYVDQKQKTPFHVKTGCWTCPFGRDDQGKITVVISDNEYFKIEELDNYGREVCKYFLRQENVEIPDDPDDLPYKSLIHTVDGLDTLVLQLNDRSRVFDSNGVKLEDELAQQWTSAQFSANFLLSLGLRVWSGDGNGNESGNPKHFYWSVLPSQIKIKRYCTLPTGCQIFETEPAFTKEVDKRKKIEVRRKQPEEDSVIDFDPDVNELLD